MTSEPRSDPHLIDRFSQVTAAHIVPLLLLVVNLLEYLFGDGSDVLHFNILASIYLLGTSLAGDRVSLDGFESDKSEKSTADRVERRKSPKVGWASV